MKGLKPMTAAERQEAHRERLRKGKGKRLSVTLSAESLAALDEIVMKHERTGETKRACIEKALIAYADFLACAKI